MSSSNKPVLRQEKKTTVENIALPNWDRQGNVIRDPKKVVKPQPKPTKVEDVAEEKVKIPTLKEVEAIREEAYNEGFEQGYQSGLSQGQRDGEIQGKKDGYEVGQQEGLAAGIKTGQEQALAEERAKTDEKLSVLDRISIQMRDQILVEQSELEEALLGLSIRIARQVLQDELRLQPEHISVVVHAAVQSLPNADEKLSLLLNPADIEFVESFADSHWELVADDSVSPGGCKVKSGFSYIDYTLEHRFNNAVNHLITHLDSVDEQSLKAPITDETLVTPEAELRLPDEPVAESESDDLKTERTAAASTPVTEESDTQETEQASIDSLERDKTVDEQTSLPDESVSNPAEDTTENVTSSLAKAAEDEQLESEDVHITEPVNRDSATDGQDDPNTVN